MLRISSSRANVRYLTFNTLMFLLQTRRFVKLDMVSCTRSGFCLKRLSTLPRSHYHSAPRLDTSSSLTPDADLLAGRGGGPVTRTTTSPSSRDCAAVPLCRARLDGWCGGSEQRALRVRTACMDLISGGAVQAVLRVAHARGPFPVQCLPPAHRFINEPLLESAATFRSTR